MVYGKNKGKAGYIACFSCSWNIFFKEMVGRSCLRITSPCTKLWRVSLFKEAPTNKFFVSPFVFNFKVNKGRD